MKKLICLFASLALVVAVAACGDKDGEQTEKPPIEEPEEPEKPKEEPQPEPRLPLYSLEGTPSYWTNFHLFGDLILLNSNEELQHYIVGTDYPPIDFSKHTLILAKGGTTNGVAKKQLVVLNGFQLANI